MANIFAATFDQWKNDKAPRLSAALAYYTILSIAPLMLILVAIAGMIFGSEAAGKQMIDQIKSLTGPTGGQALEEILRSASQSQGKAAASIFGLATLLFGASRVFAQLQDALNTIWNVEPKPRQGIKRMVLKRLMSFGMVLAIGFLLLVSLALSAALAATSKYFSTRVPFSPEIFMAVSFVVTFLVITGLFALIFKFLPDARVRWRDVWVGALMTAALFTIGKYLIGMYLGRTAAASAYGAAGSFVVVLLWVYYSSLIAFFGAEFTQVWATRHGRAIRPAPYARRVGGGDGRDIPPGEGTGRLRPA